VEENAIIKKRIALEALQQIDTGRGERARAQSLKIGGTHAQSFY
jgi:hypothetical protein